MHRTLVVALTIAVITCMSPQAHAGNSRPSLIAAKVLSIAAATALVASGASYLYAAGYYQAAKATCPPMNGCTQAQLDPGITAQQAAWGLLAAGGATLVAAGISGIWWLVADRHTSTANLMITPYFTADGGGIGAIGRF